MAWSVTGVGPVELLKSSYIQIDLETYLAWLIVLRGDVRAWVKS